MLSFFSAFGIGNTINNKIPAEILVSPSTQNKSNDNFLQQENRQLFRQKPILN